MYEQYDIFSSSGVPLRQAQVSEVSAASLELIDNATALFGEAPDEGSDGIVLPSALLDAALEGIIAEQNSGAGAPEQNEVLTEITSRREQLTGKLGEVIARSDLIGFSNPRMRPVWVGRIAAKQPALEAYPAVGGVYVGMTMPVCDVFGGTGHEESKYFGNHASVLERDNLSVTAYGFVISPTGLRAKRNYWPELAIGWKDIDLVACGGQLSKVEHKRYVAARRIVKRHFTANTILPDSI